MTEENFDTQSVKNDEFATRESDNFAENIDTSVENRDFLHTNAQKVNLEETQEQNLQKSDVFQDIFSQKSSDIESTSDQVSNFDVQSSGKNLQENIKFLSREEDNLLFSRLFPGIDREKLEKDAKFKLFSDGKDKTTSFCALYADYLTFVQQIRDEVTVRYIISKNNRLSSPGALSSPESNDGDYFSKEQVQKMTREQIARNYIKIRESQQNW